MKVAQWCPTLCDPVDWSLPASSVCEILQARILENSLLKGIFLTQGSNPGLPQCRQVLYRLSHRGSCFALHTILTPVARTLLGTKQILKYLLKEAISQLAN